jgi:hypothetical protein
MPLLSPTTSRNAICATAKLDRRCPTVSALGRGCRIIAKSVRFLIRLENVLNIFSSLSPHASLFLLSAEL